jgi:hypothetical protein
MEIQIGYYELLEAVQDYVKKHHGLSFADDDLTDPPCFETQKEIRQPKRHKNGKPVKIDGYTMFENIRSEPVFTEFRELDVISFSLMSSADREKFTS